MSMSLLIGRILKQELGWGHKVCSIATKKVIQAINMKGFCTRRLTYEKSGNTGGVS